MEQKNAELQGKLDKTLAEKKDLEENLETLTEAEAEEKNTNLALKEEFDENEKKLREKYMQLRTELSKEARQIAAKTEEVEQEKESIKAQKEALEEERAHLIDEISLLKSQVETIVETQGNENNNAAVSVSAETVAQIRTELEREYKEREKAILEKMEREKQALVAREAQLMHKESTLTQEEARIKEESRVVATMMPAQLLNFLSLIARNTPKIVSNTIANTTS